jgi:O-methyltransferase
MAGRFTTAVRRVAVRSASLAPRLLSGARAHASLYQIRRVAVRSASLAPRLLRRASAHASLYHWTREHPAPVVYRLTGDLNAAIYAGLGRGRIDYLEFGVAHGSSLRRWLELSRHPDSRFIGFDSFEGLPEDWDTGAGVKTAGTFGRAGQPPPIDDPRVQLIKGWFQDTVPNFLETFKPRPPVVVHLDADLYSSTLYVLTLLDRVLRGGAVLIFDEFHVADHEFRAFADYTSAYRRNYSVLGASRPAGFLWNTRVAIRIEPTA